MPGKAPGKGITIEKVNQQLMQISHSDQDLRFIDDIRKSDPLELAIQAIVRGAFLTVGRILAVVLLAALAGCARAPAPPPGLPQTPMVIDPDSACLKELAEAQVVFEPVESFGSDQGCGIANPVKVSATSVPWNKASVLSCPLARTVTRFETDVLQPLAQRHFGQPVRKIHHAGTYDCRQKRNKTTQAAARSGSSLGGRLSEHSKGQAIDITAFELADGTMVSVKNHWSGAGPRSDFLQQVARASCGNFNVVLTPNHDRWHRDHFHLDIGPNALCGM